MVDEKTLLQQIRDKELEVNKKLEAVRQETEGIIATAKTEADKIIREGEQSGKVAADELYRIEKEKIEVRINEMKKTAAAEAVAAQAQGERALNAAIEKIVTNVTMR